MIFDSLKNCAFYYAVSPRLKQAFDYILSTDLQTLEAGRHTIDGENIFVNVIECDLKKTVDAKLEVHNKYIDIQVVVRGLESFGWSERADVRQPQSAFDTEKDICFYDDVPQTYYTLKPGQFTILMPDDAHAPMVGKGCVKKLIVKVLK
ncbi:MAG: YhcH/YjgK/YiaL family protein [Alistipes sp.]